MASLNYYKSETEKICKSKGWDRAEINTVWLLLTEEFGELASAIRQSKKMFKKTNIKKDKGVDIMMEMGDVFSYLFQLAHMLDVDLDQTIPRTWKKDDTQKIYLLIVVKMSKHMLSDQASIDKINPYVSREFSLPGSSRRPNTFAPHKKPIEDDTTLMNDNTYICETAITSGDKVIDACRPSKVECRLSRPLIPGRNIDMGVSESAPLSIQTVKTVVENVKNVVKNMKTLDLFTITLIVTIILVLSSVRR